MVEYAELLVLKMKMDIFDSTASRKISSFHTLLVVYLRRACFENLRGKYGGSQKKWQLQVGGVKMLLVVVFCNLDI